MPMKRLQIMIEEELDEALGREARQEHTSKAALIRRYVAEGLLPLPPLDEDPIWQMAGLVAGAADDSERVDDVVYGPRTQ